MAFGRALNTFKPLCKTRAGQADKKNALAHGCNDWVTIAIAILTLLLYMRG